MNINILIYCLIGFISIRIMFLPVGITEKLVMLFLMVCAFIFTFINRYVKAEGKCKYIKLPDVNELMYKKRAALADMYMAAGVVCTLLCLIILTSV